MATFLTICPTSSIQLQDNIYHATLMPKNYKHWRETDPQVLLVEGIHQFSVRIAMLMIYVPNNIPLKHQGHILPSQLKSLTWHSVTTYEPCVINGKLETYGKHFLITFKVKLYNELLADGEILASQI